MRTKELVIRIQLPTRIGRRWMFSLGGVALLMGAVVYAMPQANPITLDSFSAGEALSSSKVNANLQATQSAVSNLQTRMTAAEAQLSGNGNYALGATFCGTSIGSFTGSLTDGALTGYAAGKSICQKSCGATTAHMCTSEELVRSSAVGGPFLPKSPANAYYWYASGITTDGAIGDCEDFTSGTSSGGDGAAWLVGSTQMAPSAAACSSSLPIACCN